MTYWPAVFFYEHPRFSEQLDVEEVPKRESCELITKGENMSTKDKKSSGNKEPCETTKKVSGTKEWATSNVNIQSGCPDDGKPSSAEAAHRLQETEQTDEQRTTSETASALAVQEILERLENADKMRTAFAGNNEPEKAEEASREYDRLHAELGKATGADYRIDEIGCPINVYEYPRKDGIKKNPEFSKKGLCNYSAGIGVRCGHQCGYCSSDPMMRTHKAFIFIGLSSFVRGFAIVDPDSPERIKRQIPKNLTEEDTIQLSTIDDAWSPEARHYDLGRRVMEVLLEETPAQIRVLTKSAEIVKDFDLFEKYKDRIIMGLSTGIPRSREDYARAVEPNASTVAERLDALKLAHDMGMRTYGMLCPVLPLVGDSTEALEEMFDDVLNCGAEDIWLEPVNARGKAFVNTRDLLIRAGLPMEAEAVDAIRTVKVWSQYTHDLIEKSIAVAESKGVLQKLHILLYPSGLTSEHELALREMGDSIIWLGNSPE